MNNPFDVANYKSQIDWAKSNHAYKISVQQSAVVNKRRSNNEEPSQPFSAKGRDTEPGKFAVQMPVMAKYDRNAARRQKTKDKRNAQLQTSMASS